MEQPEADRRLLVFTRHYLARMYLCDKQMSACEKELENVIRLLESSDQRPQVDNGPEHINEHVIYLKEACTQLQAIDKVLIQKWGLIQNFEKDGRFGKYLWRNTTVYIQVLRCPCS